MSFPFGNILILLSSYNGEKYIQEQIVSLENQQNVSVTILIRDDGSKDSTVQVVKSLQQEYKNIVLIEGENIGCAKSFSELLVYASKTFSAYDYYAFCDQDDFWLSEKLKTAVSVLNSMSKEKQLLYCSNLYVVDKNLQNRKKKYKNGFVKIIPIASLAESYGTGCTMVFNKAVVDFYVSHIPENLHLHDLWIYHQCVFLGHVFYDDESYILYRQHGNNVVGARTSLKQNFQSKIRSLKKLLRIYSIYLNDEDILPYIQIFQQMEDDLLKLYQNSLKEKINEKKYEEYVNIFTNLEFMDKWKEHLIHCRKLIGIFQNVNDKKSLNVLEKLMIQLLGHSEKDVRNNAVRMLNMIYDETTWQEKSAFPMKNTEIKLLNEDLILELNIQNEEYGDKNIVLIVSTPCEKKNEQAVNLPSHYRRKK